MTLTLEAPPEPLRLPPATQRWLRMGPWYAMFPMDFALAAIREHTRPGDAVLDPFMGRGTTLAAATALGRNAAGVEINPIAWLYARTKTDPATARDVLRRLEEIEALARTTTVPEMPEFFSWAFCPDVLRFLTAARTHLRWKDRKVDRTLMAFILVDLHGKDKDALSNQMRQTKSMGPDYSVRWWKERDMTPRQKDAGELLRGKIRWRYHHGLPDTNAKAKAVLGDSTRDLGKTRAAGPFRLLLTSPPYCGVINYNYDQWIRRWMLGGPAHPTYSSGEWQDRFEGQVAYRRLLERTFNSAATAALLTPDARVLVRTDAREFTLNTTIDVLRTAFPNKQLRQLHQPFSNPTQTHLFGDKDQKPGEVDLLLEP
ncbi:hypothetical protein DAERI_010062 [Deinococcus aerius]|uniref:Methyltransferase n=1 Tax=Deinococcus aerius TaxID=200253 RepID=A0A2I9D1I9_9DEIO|nr:DNA methyltransferase [Deinococcus aerius]GBF03890.1 hypothetical protein DAERI_010062 [Deinococcus aerius]